MVMGERIKRTTRLATATARVNQDTGATHPDDQATDGERGAVAPRTPQGPVTPPTAAPPVPAVPDRRSYLVRSLLAGILLGAQQGEQQRPGQVVPTLHH